MAFSSRQVRFTRLSNTGDKRGNSFGVPLGGRRHLISIKNIHVTTLRVGHVRGNHYHSRAKEILIVLYEGKWSAHWDSGPGTKKRVRLFDGEGAVRIQIDTLASHAIVNEGEKIYS